MKRLALAIAIATALMFGAPAPSIAVQPDEVLADAGLEARAREISTHLRCLVCQNQSIDDSDAALARDLRILVRERLVAGDSDEQVIDYIVARYGEFVLLKPRFSWRNAALWATPAVLLVAGALAILMLSRRRTVLSAPPLSTEESDALKKILGER